MAGKSADEVYVAVDGVVSTAPVGTAAPASAIAALNAAFKDLGYVSEDGVTETTNRETEPLKAWQNNKTVRNLVTEADVQYSLVLIQTSAETVALYYGGTVDSATGRIVVNPSAERVPFALVLDVIDGDNRIRAHAPEAEVTEVGEQVYQNGAPIGYEVTVTCNYNETLGGSVEKWYSELVVTP